MVAGWAGSLGAVDGVNVIAGTGSMTYGEHGRARAARRRLGRAVRRRGLGVLDRGPGLATFARMCDGRLPAARCRSVLTEHLGARRRPRPRRRRAEPLAGRPRPDRRARPRSSRRGRQDGDAACAAILARGRPSSSPTWSTPRVDQLGFAADEVVPVSYSGGIFAVRRRSAPPSATALDGAPASTCATPLLAPALGAALYAARLARHPARRRGDRPAPLRCDNRAPRRHR